MGTRRANCEIHLAAGLRGVASDRARTLEHFPDAVPREPHTAPLGPRQFGRDSSRTEARVAQGVGQFLSQLNCAARS